ncbi:type 2 lanthipeptide synthetase LanM [Sellimonas caecigallum]
MREAYLSERIYQDTNSENFINEERKRYWEQLLGKEIVKEMITGKPEFLYYLQEQLFETKIQPNDSILKAKIQEKEMERTKLTNKATGKIYFEQFYQSFVIQGKYELARRIASFEDIDEVVYGNFIGDLSVRLQNISLRTLIAELHGYKEKGKLYGNSTEEEYQSFCRIVGTREFFLHIEKTYPVLIRCITECVEKTIHFYEKVILWFCRDKEQIKHTFCNGKDKDIGKIIKIESGLSDLHNEGQQVLKIGFQNGEKILLKPRSMKNEQTYLELLEWISKRTGTEQYYPLFLSYEDHSWCSIAEYQMCKSHEELGRYYRRLGEQLFLTYFLGTKDIHYENLIACGEYPVIVDLEALTYNTSVKNCHKAKDVILDWINESVLSVGILPSYTWNSDGKGIDSSAMNGKGGQKLPFRMPVLANGETSDIRIVYKERISSDGKNIARTEEGEEKLTEYIEDVIKGFAAAYLCAAKEKKEFADQIKKLRHLESRYIVAHTQRYTMLLSSSYHPSLLMDGADREIFFYALKEGRKDYEKEIIQREIRTLLAGDIPSFSFCMDDTGIYAGKERCRQGYFEETSYNRLQKKTDRLCLEDLQNQCDLIRTSMELIPENQTDYCNKMYKTGKCTNWSIEAEEKSRAQVVDSLADRLCRYAIWNTNKTEVSWFVLRFSAQESCAWGIRPMGMYLYDGLAGMLLLTTMLRSFSKYEKIKEYQKVLKRQLFQYTDKGAKSCTNLQSRSIGAYSGEGSLVYTYLNLYKMTDKKEYLNYAIKHTEIVYEILGEETSYDLVEGAAGAAWVFLLLYEETGNQIYVKYAEKTIQFMMPLSVQIKNGIGWNVENQSNAMGGMAHGNAGILMPVIYLWELTKKKEYEILAEQIWKYEDSLYQERTGNWIDVRAKGEMEEDAVAWCHGAAGILLSRVWCYERVTDKKWKNRLRTDAEKAYEKTRSYWKRDSWTLCHGCAGNLWILEIAERVLKKKRERRSVFDNVKLLPQERMNPGFMAGYGGILFYLLRETSKWP